MTALSDLYHAHVADGGLDEDAAQMALLPSFERLKTYLEEPRRRGLGTMFRSREEAPGGLYLWGGVGRGKSMLMDLFIGSLGISGKRRIHFHEFMQSVHTGMNAARKAGARDALAPVADDLAAGLRCLALDEIQITDITDAMIVGRLFERLMAAGVVIVTTSNRPPEDLYKNGLNRALFLPFIDLIRERLEVRELQSEADYRQSVLAGSPSYFTPADTAARAAIDGLWVGLTGDTVHNLDLTVKGRTIRLEPYHGGVARMSFEALCGKPLGPADYLAIAGALRVLIIEDIPLLGPANFDRTKRFVTLVDTLYEARVRLIASAAAPPEGLYVAGTGSFEFERTASRLKEMRGAGWGRD